MTDTKHDANGPTGAGKRPTVICHMIVSLDGRIHASRWTKSPDGNPDAWSATYEKVHELLAGDAWLVGRTTMAEMAKGEAHPPRDAGPVERPHHFARRDAQTYAIAIDRSGKLHFAKPDIGGDAVVVLLGKDVPDTHLAELASDGISYIVAANEDMAISPMLEALRAELGIERLLLEGGGHTNGSLLADGLVDELSVLVAPAIDGGDGVSGAFDAGAALGDKVQLTFAECTALDGGLVHLRYKVRAGADVQS